MSELLYWFPLCGNMDMDLSYLIGHKNTKLISSQNGKDKFRKDRKKERKLEKERKKEHKHDKSRNLTNDKYQESLNNYSDEKLDFRSKGNESEAEQPEKSDITVEHDQPACSGSVFFASDNSQNNKKRKISVSSTTSVVSGNEPQKTGIRIRFSFKNHNRGEASVSINKEVSETISSVHDSTADQAFPSKDNTSTNTKVHVGTPEVSASLVPGTSTESHSFLEENSFNNEIQRSKSPYTSLIEDWIATSIHLEQHQSEVDDWLFSTNRQEMHSSKGLKSVNIPCYTSSSLWPQAHYLQGEDVFALPYTVPF